MRLYYSCLVIATDCEGVKDEKANDISLFIA
jgi:hypothetical protein